MQQASGYWLFLPKGWNLSFCSYKSIFSPELWSTFSAKLSLKNPWAVLIAVKIVEKRNKTSNHNLFPTLPTLSPSSTTFFFFFFSIDKVHFHILLLALRGLIRFSVTLFIHRHFSKSCMLYIANEKGGTTTGKKKKNLILFMGCWKRKWSSGSH